MLNVAWKQHLQANSILPISFDGSCQNTPPKQAKGIMTHITGKSICKGCLQMCDFKVVGRCDFKQSLCGPVSLHQAVTFSFHWFFRRPLPLKL